MLEFKPQNTINNKSGVEPDWETRAEKPKEWLVSEKLEGVRIEIFVKTREAKTRQLKSIRNEYIQQVVDEICANPFISGKDMVLEGEIYAGVGTFDELKGWVSKKGYVEPTTNLNDWSIYLFDSFTERSQPKLQRFLRAKIIAINTDHSRLKYIPQYRFASLDVIKDKYNTIIEAGGEGIMLVKANSAYKFGRSTEKECFSFKMKDDQRQYSAIIYDVLEGDVVDPDAEKTINELGGSVTSKLQEDRIPSGRAGRLLCIVDIDGNKIKQKVSLSGFNNIDKKAMLMYKNIWIGMKITIHGKKPTKDAVLGAHFKNPKTK